MKRQPSFIILLSASIFLFLIVIFSFSFKGKNGWVSGLFRKDIKVVLVGDIMLGRSVMTTTLAKNDYTYPFWKVASELKQADIVFGNLESPLVEGCPKTDTGMIFCADPKMVLGLTFSGIDVVTLANNHIGNYGAGGITETKKTLTEYGIDYTGDGNLAVKEVRGVEFGFLGFNYIYGKPSAYDLKMIRESKKLVDILIVGVHWGEEYQAKAGVKQKEIANTLIKEGADVVVGHHPHWVQEEETINGKPVYYSLGNFVFDQMWSQKTKEGAAITLTFRNKELIKEEKEDVVITSLGQPEFVK